MITMRNWEMVRPISLKSAQPFYANHGIYSNYCNMFPALSEVGVFANPGLRAGIPDGHSMAAWIFQDK